MEEKRKKQRKDEKKKNEINLEDIHNHWCIVYSV